MSKRHFIGPDNWLSESDCRKNRKYKHEIEPACELKCAMNNCNNDRCELSKRNNSSIVKVHLFKFERGMFCYEHNFCLKCKSNTGWENNLCYDCDSRKK